MGMHMRGNTANMDKLTDYSPTQNDVVSALQYYFSKKATTLLKRGLIWRTMLDPGLGF